MFNKQKPEKYTGDDGSPEGESNLPVSGRTRGSQEVVPRPENLPELDLNPGSQQPGRVIDMGQRRAQPPIQANQPPAQPIAPVVAPRGCWGTLAFYGGASCLLMTIVIAVLVLVGVVRTLDFFGEPVDNFLKVFGIERESKIEEINTNIIIEGISNLSALQTADAVTVIEKRVVERGTTPDSSMTMRYNGSVEVGIDISLITEKDIITNPDESLTINLPPIQILDCVLRDAEIVDSDCREIPFVQDCENVIRDMQNAANDRALDDLRELTLANEIMTPNGDPLLEVGYDNAESTLANLLASLGYSNVRFVRSDEIVPPPPACFP